ERSGGKLRGTFCEGDGYPIFYGVEAFPDDRFVLVSRFDGPEVWETATGRKAGYLGGYGRVRTLAFSPDGTKLISASDGLIRVRDAGTGQRLRCRLALSGMETSFPQEDPPADPPRWYAWRPPWNVISTGSDYSLARTADGKTFAVVSPGEVFS